MKRTLLAIALAAAATGSFAVQSANGVFNNTVQVQVGTQNVQRMDAATIDSANTNVITRVNANQLWQLQGGARNTQVLQVGSVLPSAPVTTALRTDVTVTGAVVQLQGGTDNSQRARLGVIH